MFDSRRKERGCGFDEAMVSYIYGELESAEKKAFEKHLADCEMCAEEVASFAAVRISIKELKEAEPALPAEAVTAPGVKGAGAAGLIDRLREVFDAAPAFARVAVPIAALAVITVFGWFALTISRDSTGSVAETDHLGPAAAETGPSKKDENDGPLLADNKRDTGETLVTRDKSGARNETTVAKTSKRGASNAGEKKRTVRKKRKSGPSAPNSNADRIPASQLAGLDHDPRLSEAADSESEDDSLRLSDLFADSGTER